MINRDYYIFIQYQTFLLGDTQQINVVKSKQKSEKHKAFTFVKTFSNSLMRNNLFLDLFIGWFQSEAIMNIWRSEKRKFNRTFEKKQNFKELLNVLTKVNALCINQVLMSIWDRVTGGQDLLSSAIKH
jgi:hypothetical protein